MPGIILLVTYRTYKIYKTYKNPDEGKKGEAA